MVNDTQPAPCEHGEYGPHPYKEPGWAYGKMCPGPQMPQPAPCGSAEEYKPDFIIDRTRAHHRRGKKCPGIAAHRESAETWKMTDEQRRTMMGEVYGKDGLFSWEIVEAAVRLGIVAPVEDNCLECGGFPNGRCVDHNCSRHTGNTGLGRCELCPAPETKSLGADHPGPSAVQADLGPASTRPDEGAGPSEFMRHAARRESRDAGLEVTDAIMARFNKTTKGEWFVRGTVAYGNFVSDGVIFVRTEDGETDLYKSTGDASQEDDEWIVAAREDIPALVEEVQRLRAALASQPTDAEIDAAAMEYGKTAYSGYAGPGPRSQFRDGAKWALALFGAQRS